MSLCIGHHAFHEVYVSKCLWISLAFSDVCFCVVPPMCAHLGMSTVRGGCLVAGIYVKRSMCLCRIHHAFREVYVSKCLWISHAFSDLCFCVVTPMCAHLGMSRVRGGRRVADTYVERSMCLCIRRHAFHEVYVSKCLWISLAFS